MAKENRFKFNGVWLKATENKCSNCDGCAFTDGGRFSTTVCAVAKNLGCIPSCHADERNDGKEVVFVQAN